MLESRHRARIDVEIGIEFPEVNGESAGFEKAADGRSRDSFSEAGNDDAGDEDVIWSFCMVLWPLGH